jgi:CRISPR-associated protein Cas2
MEGKMLVVMASHIPPAVRGRMKLWFIEPRPNVFISGIKDSVADDVVEYLFEHCTYETGLTIFQRINKPPGYKIRGLGDLDKALVQISGMQLVQEKSGVTNIQNIGKQT